MQSEPRGPWWERTRGVDFDVLVAANDGAGRVAGAGEWFHYSNLGYGLLGEVLARRSGAPWRLLVADRLLGPLDMRTTSYLPRPGAQPGWSVDHFTGIRVHEPLTDTGAMAPAGQLWSTLADLVTWGQFLGGSRPDLLAAETLREMQTPVEPDYGLGLMLGVHPGGRVVGHDGSMPGFMASLHVDPDSGIGAAVLTNATTGIAPQELAVSLIEGDPDADDERPAAWRPTGSLPDDVAGVPGVWFWGNTAYDVRWHNDGLELRLMARGGLLRERFELVDGRPGRGAGLPPRRAAGRRTPGGRVDPQPRVRDLRLHARALRRRGPDPRRAPASVSHTPCDTLDMLKSGIRSAGVAVREK